MPDPRMAVIAQAVAYIDSAPADLLAVLARTPRIHAHLKADPVALRDILAATTKPVGPAYNAARQILDAAGVAYPQN